MLFHLLVWVKANLLPIIAAIIGAITLWYGLMPRCDMAEVEVVEKDGTVKIRSKVKNSGRGSAIGLKMWLLEYGRIRHLKHAQGYIGDLSGGSETSYQSADISLGEKRPTDNSFRVLLTWRGFFWTSGESYVEEHYHDEKARRPRVKIIYPWTQVWRSCRGYDIEGCD